MYETTTFQREDLFNKVWETPLLKLAQTIGISDVALAKACRRAGIPLPGRGHWAKQERARAKKPKLPQLKNPHYQIIRFQVPKAGSRDGFDLPKAIKGEPIAIPAHVDEPHPLVARTLKGAAKAKIEQGVLQLDRKRVLDIRVSPDTLDRAIRMMDALIKASEAQGHAWKVTEDGKTAITVDKETFHFSLHEKMNRQELPPPPPPPRPKHPSAAWRPQINLLFHSHPRYDWTSTGRLTISLDGVGLHGLPQKNWNDTERTPLESKLHEVLASFVPAAAAIKADRAETQRREQEYEAYQIRQRERAQCLAHQQRLRVRLVQATAHWEQAQRLRAFCTAVSARLADLTEEEQVKGNAWLQWASEQISKLDPLQQDLGTLFDLEQPKEMPYTSGYQQRDENDWWSDKLR